MINLVRNLSFVFLGPLALSAATFTVNSTDDGPDANPGDGVCATSGGTCTLRAAIQEANALTGTDTINFNIIGSGSGPQTINLTSALPTITDPVIIDATTQPGYAGAPLIELNGSGASGQANGLSISAGNSTVQGLVINRFPAHGIFLSRNGGNVIAGNYVGIDSTGTVALGNAKNGLEIDSANNQIGGTTVAARNVISGNLGTGGGGVSITGITAGGNVIQGNYIGTDATGTTRVSNSGRGIVIRGSPNNLIGGTAPGAGNVISGNGASGIRVYISGGDGNVIQGNFIGTDATGKLGPRLGNGRGVQLRTNNNLVGGTLPGSGNLIEGNRIDGVAFLEDNPTNNLVQGNTIAFNGKGVAVYTTGGTGNAILGNSIFSNTGLGIDLYPFGVTPNDPCDTDTGPNNLQNFPVLSSAASSPGTTSIIGTLNSTPNTSFTIQFFVNVSCDPSGYGEGRRFIGQATVTTDGTCNGSFTTVLPLQTSPGHAITSTATDPNGNTSEFSACTVVSGI